MTLLREVLVLRQPVTALEPVIGAKRYAQLLTSATRLRETLGRRTIWNVNSASVGGGVAEMLSVLVGYAAAGVLSGDAPQVPGRFARRDGTIGEVTRAGMVTGEDRPGPADPVVVQVSRWDRLKDMSGVMRGFAEHVVPVAAGYLMLVGPAVSGVADDPEGAAVFGECLALWRSLPAAPAREYSW